MTNKEVTSDAAARAASRTLAGDSTGSNSKSAAGSALSQTGSPEKTTSEEAATSASQVLRDGRTADDSKSAAGSALSQKTAGSS